jgi:hypothetical protein
MNWERRRRAAPGDVGGGEGENIVSWKERVGGEEGE